MSHTDKNGNEISNNDWVVMKIDGSTFRGLVMTAGAYRSLVRFGNDADWYDNERLVVEK